MPHQQDQRRCPLREPNSLDHSHQAKPTSTELCLNLTLISSQAVGTCMVRRGLDLSVLTYKKGQDTPLTRRSSDAGFGRISCPFSYLRNNQQLILAFHDDFKHSFLMLIHIIHIPFQTKRTFSRLILNPIIIIVLTYLQHDSEL